MPFNSNRELQLAIDMLTRTRKTNRIWLWLALLSLGWQSCNGFAQGICAVPMPGGAVKVVSPKHAEYLSSLGTPMTRVAPSVLVLTAPADVDPIPYYIGGRSSGQVDSLPWVNSLTNSGVTNIVSTLSNYVGEFHIIWTPQALPSPYTAVGIQVSQDGVNWVYYPDSVAYFRVYPDENGNLGMVFGADDDVDNWFFRGVPE